MKGYLALVAAGFLYATQYSASNFVIRCGENITLTRMGSYSEFEQLIDEDRNGTLDKRLLMKDGEKIEAPIPKEADELYDTLYEHACWPSNTF